MTIDRYEIVRYEPGLRESLLELQTWLWAETPDWPVTIVDCESATTAGASELLAAAVEMAEPASLRIWSCALCEEGRKTLLQLGLTEHPVASITESFPTVLVRLSKKRPGCLGCFTGATF